MEDNKPPSIAIVPITIGMLYLFSFIVDRLDLIGKWYGLATFLTLGILCIFLGAILYYPFSNK